MCFEAELNLGDIPSLKNDGLDAMINTLIAIKAKISPLQAEKARLDSRVNNLIYLYGQKHQNPIFNDIKPYFTQSYRSYYKYKTNIRKLYISGIDYYINLHNKKKYGQLNHLYMLNEHTLLHRYFEATTKDEIAIKINMKCELIGGFTNTPVFAFRARYDYKQKECKYHHGNVLYAL